MPVPGAAGRAIQELTVGTVHRMNERRIRSQEIDLHEHELQYQLTIEGLATSVPAFAAVTVDFEDWEFHYAPAQRDSELRWPHHGYGAYIPRGGPVAVGAVITEWTVRPENDAIIGCVMQFWAVCDSAEPRAFGGWVHNTFQGLAMSRDDLSDTPDLEVGTE